MGGSPLLGVFMLLPSPGVVELIGHAGFDFVVIDMEHGPAGFETAEHMVRAAEVSGLLPVIRVGDNQQTLILRALEVGARVIDVPMISTAEEAAAVVRAARYHPDGMRGHCPVTRGAGYGMRADTLAWVNSRIRVMVQIETVEGMRNVRNIARTPGVDIVFIGTGDLSHSMGCPGEMNDALIREVDNAVDAIRNEGKSPAVIARSAEAAERWAAAGAEWVACAVDLPHILRSFRETCENMRKEVTRGARMSGNI